MIRTGEAEQGAPAGADAAAAEIGEAPGGGSQGSAGDERRDDGGRRFVRGLYRAFGEAEQPLVGAPFWRRHAHLILVVGAVVYGLVALAPERLAVAYPNDAAVHLLSVSTALHDLRAGHMPYASWFPDLATGSPFFLHYQSTPAVLTALLAWVIGVPAAFGWTLYLLLALFPLSIYWSARMFGFGRYTSAIAAATSLFLYSVVGYGVEQQSFDWLGSGLWTELWGIWVLPLAWAASYRAVAKREFRLFAAVMLAATIAFHFLTAYLAGLSLIMFIFLRPTRIWPRARRALTVGAGAAGMSLFVLVPLAIYGKWGAANEIQVGTFWDDSYGARKVLGWLFTGQLYDYGRFPVVTILVFVGLVAAILRWRRDEAARAVVGLWVLSLLLYFGRPTLGPIIDLLPGNQSLLLHRYIMGVQLAGLFLAGIGALALAQSLGYLARRVLPEGLLATPAASWSWWRPVVAIGAVVVILAPAWSQLIARDRDNSVAIAGQQAADQVQGAQVNALIARAESLGEGRIFGGLLGDGWEPAFRVGQVEMCIYLADQGVDAVGFSLRTSALMSNPEAYFDEHNPGDYAAFGIRYLFLPAGMNAPVPAKFLGQLGQYVLWEVPTRGDSQVVDTSGSIAANANDLGANTTGFLSSSEISDGIYPTIAFSGAPAAVPTLLGPRPAGPAGEVLSSRDDLIDGSYRAIVEASRTSVVLLAASFDPGWHVTVDGVPAATEMVAPALVGVTVTPGTHSLVFTYQGYRHYELLFAIGLLVFVLGLAGPRLERRWRRRAPRHARTAS